MTNNTGCSRLFFEALCLLILSGLAAQKLVNEAAKGDPCFVNVEKGDYRFRPDSPALKLGIQPIDVSKAGRTER